MSPSQKKQALVCLERLASYVERTNPPTERASLERDLAFLRTSLTDFDAFELGRLRAVEIQARLILPTAKRCGVKVLELTQTLEAVRVATVAAAAVAPVARDLPAELKAASAAAPQLGPVSGPAIPCAKSQGAK